MKRILLSLVAVLALAGTAHATHPSAFRARFVAPRHHRVNVVAVQAFHVAPVVAVQAVYAQPVVQVQAYSAPVQLQAVQGCAPFFQSFRAY